MHPLKLLLLTTAILGQAALASEPTGRLFFSDNDRAALEQLRQRGEQPRAPGIVAPVSSVPIEQVTVNGIVRRSNGKSTVWINQVPQHDGERSQGIAVVGQSARPPAVGLQLPSGRRVDLKAGQTFDVGKGEVREAYQDNVGPRR